MGRVIIGAAAAAVAMFIIGFIFYATPLAKLGTGSVDDRAAAAVQQVMAANLPETGTYAIPGIDTPAQTNMYSRGPVATVHYNSGGFAGMEPGALAGGLVLNFIVALLVGLALVGVADRVLDFGARARLVLIFAIAASALFHLKEPLFYHHDWSHFIYTFIADAIMLAVGGLIIARWFLGGIRTAANRTEA